MKSKRPTFEQLAPYLPHGLNGIDMGLEFQLVGFKAEKHVSSQILPIWEYTGDKAFIAPRDHCKPLLHPWPNLAAEQQREIHNYDMLIMTLAEKIFAEDTDQRYPTMDALHIAHTKFMANRMAYCYENHLDVHDLIGQGLAEPIKSE